MSIDQHEDGVPAFPDEILDEIVQKSFTKALETNTRFRKEFPQSFDDQNLGGSATHIAWKPAGPDQG